VVSKNLSKEEKKGIMAMKERLKEWVARTARLGEGALREQRIVEQALAAALQHPDSLSVRYPVSYAKFLRSCIECPSYSVVEIKSEAGAPEIAGKRFATFIDQLRLELPEMELPAAREIALIRDDLRSNSQSKTANYPWAGDVGLHSSIGSVSGGKGRILFNLVRFARSERCLELGTAYGISALFILAALRLYFKSGHLTTLEGSEPQFSIASALLKGRYGDMVSCHFGLTGKLLPGLVKSIGPIDFMFHDAGHSHDDYVNDFNLVSQSLGPGAIVLFDDIRWGKDERWKTSSKPIDTYGGWKEVVGHSRVCRAFEVDGTLGLLQLR
jgi:predicted O-methyltransferase YrrM